jgi:hypothetical protein
MRYFGALLERRPDEGAAAWTETEEKAVRKKQGEGRSDEIV